MSTSPVVKARIASDAGQALLARVAQVAQEAGETAQGSPGSSEITVEGRSIAALPGGMCDKFARQVQELAMKIPDGSWQFHAGSAAQTEHLLIVDNRRIGGCIPGAVGCWDDGTVGHIVTYIGNGYVAENTSGTRGNPSRPGTKITKLDDVIAAHGGDSGRWYYASSL